MMNFYELHSNPEQLYGYDRIMQIPQIAWEMADDKQKKKMTDIWLKDPITAGEYAQLMGKAWPQAEPIIAQDMYAASDYAQIVLGHRFPAGEAAIARDPELAQLYAVYILKGPWPQAEAVIASSEDDAYMYAKLALDDPKPKTWARRYKAKHGL